MKLSVSTLGCPTWTLDEILTRCKSYGYDAIELRGIGAELDVTKLPEFATPDALAKTKRRIHDTGLAVSAIDSSCTFADPSKTSENLDHGRAMIDLAHAMDSRYMRVFGGGYPDTVDSASAVRHVAEALTILGDYASSTGVIVVLETHDSFSTGAQVAEILGMIDHPNVAALWDLHHPFRHGEQPSDTARLIGDKIAFTHVKDSIPGGTYCLLGDGNIPVLDCLKQLKSIGYDDYVSVEWEKRWRQDLVDPEIAFPQYAAKMREYLAQL
jgi:sugar phosphate isomerase/epimerase